MHEILRKTLLTGVIIYLQARPLIQSNIAVMICLSACCTLNFFQPHKNRVVFWLAQLSFIITSLKFLSAVILISARDDTEKENIGFLMICLDLIFFVGSIIGTILAIYLLWSKIKEIDNMHKTDALVNKKTKIVPLSETDQSISKTKAEKAWQVEK